MSDILPDRVETLALPQEDPEPRALSAESRELNDAATLFPAQLWPLPPAPVLDEEDDALPSAATNAVVSGNEPLSPEVAASCFGPAPPPPLHDPQNLLTPAQRAPLTALLRDSLNARDSFQISVVVLQGSQQIPVTLNPPELLQRWYGAKKGLLVLYFLGQPDRTQAFFSPETLQHHRSEDLRQVIDFSVREAARMPAPLNQLQRFCYKAAIRLDRLHRQGVVSPSDEALPVVASPPAAGLWWAFAIGAQATALAAGAVWWWRRRPAGATRPGETVLFPDQDLISRLNGPHSGGNGAVIQFGAAGHRL